MPLIEIDRVTDYEQGLVGHHSFRGGDGRLAPFIRDERFIAAYVPGRGVTVLSACSHAGIVNACLGVTQHFPNAPVDVVWGVAPATPAAARMCKVVSHATLRLVGV